MTTEKRRRSAKLPQHHRAQITEWYHEFGNEIRMHIAGHQIQKHEVDDLLQDVFYVAVSKAENYREQGNARAFLFAIARNLILSKIRKQKKSRCHSNHPCEMISDSPQACELEQNEQLGRIRSQLTKLSATEQEVIRLRIVLNQTFRSISKTIQCPKNTVVSHFRRAIRKIQNRLRD